MTRDHKGQSYIFLTGDMKLHEEVIFKSLHVATALDLAVCLSPASLHQSRRGTNQEDT